MVLSGMKSYVMLRRDYFIHHDIRIPSPETRVEMESNKVVVFFRGSHVETKPIPWFMRSEQYDDVW